MIIYEAYRKHIALNEFRVNGDIKHFKFRHPHFYPFLKI